MTDPKVNDRVARLARVLEEHEVWDRVGRTMPEDERARILTLALREPHPCGCDLCQDLRAAIREVESGEFLGTTHRCAVCGAKTGTIIDTAWKWGDPHYHRCVCCGFFIGNAETEQGISGRHAGADGTARLIFRARRLYRESKVKPAPHVHTWQLSGENKQWTRWRCTVCGMFEMGEPRVHPVREWGMKCPPSECGLDDQSLAWATWKRELFGLCGYIMLDGGRRRPARKIRAEVKKKPDEALVERVADAIAENVTRRFGPVGWVSKYLAGCSEREQRNIRKAARAAIAEVRKTEAGR